MTQYGTSQQLLAKAIVDEMIARGVGFGEEPISNSSSQIIEQIGAINSPTALYYQLSDGYETDYPWSINSLIRGISRILGELYQLVSSGVRIYPSQVPISNSSGVINNPNVSFRPNTDRFANRYLLIQNLPIEPTGDLWINFTDVAAVGSGSICLAPGESLKEEGLTLPGNTYISILGTTAGMQYTFLIN